MTATPYLPALDSIPLDEILADALILNWSDLMPELASGQIHIEYHVETMGSVEFVKVWGSTIRGCWNLICEHWMLWADSHQGGLHFDNGYKSDRLAKMLDTIMQHQGIFLVGAAPGEDRMIQVHPPTDDDRVSANRTMDVLRERLAA
jgi:hypothetical protein